MEGQKVLGNPVNAIYCRVAVYDIAKGRSFYWLGDGRWTTNVEDPNLFRGLAKDYDSIMVSVIEKEQDPMFLYRKNVSLQPVVTPVVFKRSDNGLWAVQNRFTDEWHNFVFDFNFNGFNFNGKEDDAKKNFPSVINVEPVDGMGDSYCWVFDKSALSFEGVIGASRVYFKDDVSDVGDLEEFDIPDTNDLLRHIKLTNPISVSC